MTNHTRRREWIQSNADDSISIKGMENSTHICSRSCHQWLDRGLLPLVVGCKVPGGTVMCTWILLRGLVEGLAATSLQAKDRSGAMRQIMQQDCHEQENALTHIQPHKQVATHFAAVMVGRTTTTLRRQCPCANTRAARRMRPDKACHPCSWLAGSPKKPSLVGLQQFLPRVVCTVHLANFRTRCHSMQTLPARTCPVVLRRHLLSRCTQSMLAQKCSCIPHETYTSATSRPVEVTSKA